MPRVIALLAFASLVGAQAQPVPVHILSGAIIAVPPPVIDGPRPPALNAPAPPLEIPKAAALTNCDPGGCWDSEGRRLDRVGPVLTGPRGACTEQAGVVRCP
jgi:hypothetical protein